MQKVAQILEKNVEWIALALGVGFLGFMVWSYLLNPPVVAVINGSRLNPGNVDDFILNGPVQSLKERMTDPQIPTFQVQDFSKLISQRLNPPPTPPSQQLLFAGLWDWQPAQIPTSISTPMAGGPVITELPELPPAQPLLVITGQSSIVSFPTTAAPPPANPAAPAAQGAGRTDVHWVTAAFSVPVGPLAAEWKKAFGPTAPNQPWKLPDAMRDTFFLDVTAYRSEQLPDGQWGPDVEVARLPNNPVQPMPPANQLIAERQYLLWASPHFADIATPPFPDLAAAPAGSAWLDPGQQLQTMIGTSAAPAAGAAAPAQPAAAAAPANNDPSQQIIPVKPLPSAAPIPPTAAFNFLPATGAPAGPMPDMLVYINDLVESGKTYRYCLSYKLRNPMFDLPAARVRDPQWASQLALVAPTSATTPAVAIPPQTYFYCAAQGGQGAKGFPFDVFTWAAGLWQQQQFTVNPGDPIGGVVGGIDYSTKSTYVDGHGRNQDFFVTVVDDNGVAKVLNAGADAGSADHKEKVQWVSQSRSTTAPSGGSDSSSSGNNTSDQ